MVLPLLGVATALFFQWIASAVARRPALAVAGIVATFALWNTLLASAFRSGAWDYAGPVTFEEMGRGASGVVDRRLGSPFSLPAALWERIRRGRALSDYESLFTERPFSRWSVRFGIDERIFLEDGWSEAREADGVLYRSVEGESAGFIVPLHRSVSYRIGIRARAPAGTPTAVRLIVNQRPVGVAPIEPSWGDHEIPVGASFLRPGRNFLRLRVLDNAGARAIDVSGAWMTPMPEPVAGGAR